MSYWRYFTAFWQFISQGVWQTFLGAIAFYTCIPIPPQWPLNFSGIARWAPVLGVLIGLGLALIDRGLALAQMPIAVRSTLVVAIWVAVTGGLHLDGAMDTADGLAVPDPQRRLEVMADSRSGAFGVMAAILIVMLKVVALSSLTMHRGFALALAAGWGRWGQLVAIARYPYLKPTGKGAFHKAAIASAWAPCPTLIVLLGISSWPIGGGGADWRLVCIAAAGSVVAISIAAWFHRQLGGHTGDTYGAVVEWTEALMLCGFTLSQQ